MKKMHAPSALPPPLVRPLLSGPSVLDFLPCGYPPIIYFCLQGDLGAVQWLIMHGASAAVRTPRCQGHITVLHAAVLSGNVVLLRYLLSSFRFTTSFLDLNAELPASYQFRHSTLSPCIWYAYRARNYGMTELLLDAGASLVTHTEASLVIVTHWRQRRLLYIARHKPNERCGIALLPHDVIKVIDRCFCALVEPKLFQPKPSPITKPYRSVISALA